MNVSSRGLRAFRSRTASHRQRMDMVALAHIREQPRLSLGSDGRPGLASASLTSCRILRSGCRVGMRASRSTELNSDPLVSTAPRIIAPSFAVRRVKRVLQSRPRADFFSCLLVPPVPPEMGGRHQLHLDPRGGVSGSDPRSGRPARHGLGRQQPHDARFGNPRLEDGHRAQVAAEGKYPPQRQRQPLLCAGRSEAPAQKWPESVNARQGRLL